MKNLQKAIVVALAIGFMGCSSASSGRSDMTDAEAVAAAKASLAIGFHSGESASTVKNNLALPATGGNGVSVTWISDDTGTISNTGTVTRPAVGSAATGVTLTATLNKGTESDTRDYSLTVLANVPSFIVSHNWQDIGTFNKPIVYTAVQSGSAIYAGTQGDGLLYSDNDGTDWSQKTVVAGGIASDQIYKIVLSDKLVLMATFQGLSVWDRNSGVDTVTNYLSGKQVYDIVVSGADVYLAVSDGVYYGTVSNFAGLTKASTTFANPRYLCLSALNLYAAGNSDATNGEELNIFTRASMATAPTKRDVISGVCTTVGPVYMDSNAVLVAVDWQFYRSTNGGNSFTSQTVFGGGKITGLASDGTNLYAVKYGSNLWHSSDSGATWSDLTVPGYTTYLGITANGVSCNGSDVLIAHNKGVVIGKIQ